MEVAPPPPPPPPPPLSDEMFEAYFKNEPGDYPGYLGHTTLELAPKEDQPPTVLDRGPTDDSVVLSDEQAQTFMRDGVSSAAPWRRRSS